MNNIQEDIESYSNPKSITNPSLNRPLDPEERCTTGQVNFKDGMITKSEIPRVYNNDLYVLDTLFGHQRQAASWSSSLPDLCFFTSKRYLFPLFTMH